MTTSSPGSRRRTLLFSGTVQGVGFRYTACRIAAGLDVSGYVRNLSTGQVELVAEGAAAELDRLQSSIEREMGGYIRSIEHDEVPATGEFSDFAVRG